MIGSAEAIMFFEGWDSLVATTITGVSAYVALVAILRLSGKRTLAKMNAFDLVVTVALGSTLSTVFVSRQVPLADGVLALRGCNRPRDRWNLQRDFADALSRQGRLEGIRLPQHP